MPQSIDAPAVPVTRRTVLGAALALPLGAARAQPAGTLDITAYDGFVPPAVRAQFEAETGISIRIRPTASQAPELNLLITEREHPITDLCTVVGSRLHQFVEAGIIEPIDTARLTHWARINPLYADAAWNRVNGAVMGVPLVTGANVMVYDTREVSPAPSSWAAMFDPKYKGRTTYDIEDFLLCTMLLQGADPTFMRYLGDEAMARRAVNAARDTLIAHKSQVVRFFEEGSELQQLLLGGDAVLAQTYASITSKLILDGQPFRRVVPQEGSLAFVYTFAVVKGAPNRDAAYRYLDTLLGTPQIGAALTRSAGYASCMVNGGDGLTEAEQAAYGLPEDALGRLRFSRFEGQALSSKLIDQAVAEVRAG